MFKISLITLAFLLAVGCVNVNTFAQDITPEDCGKTDANFRACFSKALGELQFYRNDARAWVVLLKDEKAAGRLTQTQLDEAKAKYILAQTDFNKIVDNLVGNPNFAQIKIRMKTTLPLFEAFVTDATTKLDREPANGGIWQRILGYVIDILTGNPRQAVMKIAKDLIKEYAVKSKCRWRDW